MSYVRDGGEARLNDRAYRTFCLEGLGEMLTQPFSARGLGSRTAPSGVSSSQALEGCDKIKDLYPTLQKAGG